MSEHHHRHEHEDKHGHPSANGTVPPRGKKSVDGREKNSDAEGEAAQTGRDTRVYRSEKGFLPAAFINRELSWLDFNRRVLLQSKDDETPLFEKLNFISITTNNLDEFIRVRVASLKKCAKMDSSEKDLAGLNAEEQLRKISKKMHSLLEEQYRIYRKEILKRLEEKGVVFCRVKELEASERDALHAYFSEEIYPVLSPLAVDSGRPFPLIPNRLLNLALFLRKKADAGPSVYQYGRRRAEKEERELLTRGETLSKKEKAGEKERKKKEEEGKLFATLQIPACLPRLLSLEDIFETWSPARRRDTTLPGTETPAARARERAEERSKQGVSVRPERRRFMLLEELIREEADSIFQGYAIEESFVYRILRSADFDLDEDLADDLLSEIQKQLHERDFAEVIHLEVSRGADEALLHDLKKALHCKKEDIYPLEGPLDLRFLSKLKAALPAELTAGESYPSFKPVWPQDFGLGPEEDLFALIREKDRFISLPYESFDPIELLIRRAAQDPQVLAIKQTLYRVSGSSPIIAALEEAAKNGKQVLVLLELKARFDEENNIHWARRLEMAGCHVIYGLVGLKTHSKITMIVREEAEGIRRYVHLGTGNYNDATAKIYTDCGLFTAKESYGRDAGDFFNVISGYTEPSSWTKLILAPFDLRKSLYALLDREIENARRGQTAFFRGKMNSLADREMIEKLYEASGAGVKIELIVRGINCLRAGIPGLSENIRVRSLIGRYLEHARIYHFAAGGQEEVYLSSADFMSRNLNKRVELLFPLDDAECKERAIEILELQLRDKKRAFEMRADGRYKRVPRTEGATDSMQIQERLAKERCRAKTEGRGRLLKALHSKTGAEGTDAHGR